MSKVINFLDKKQEKEVSKPKTFCVSLAGHNGTTLAYGTLFVFPTLEDRKRHQETVESIIEESAWKKRLFLAGASHSSMEPPRVLGLEREMVMRGLVEGFDAANPPYELMFVLDFISEIERKTHAVRLTKNEYFEMFDEEKK
jgi:hypothetical protein